MKYLIFLFKPDLIKKYGYSVEIHKVTTTDGYILTLHRIPQGLTCNSGNKASVILQHGLFQSSADWVFTGPDKGLGKYHLILKKTALIRHGVVFSFYFG